MPIYDYACLSCGHTLEVMHGVNITGPGACGLCGGPMRKLLSTPAIVFKGSGWAKKDARDAKPSAARKASAGDDGGGSTTTSKTEPASTGEVEKSPTGKADKSASKQSDGSGAADPGS